MSIYKRVSKHIRFDAETETAIERQINQVGNRQTFSGFVRNAVEKELIQSDADYLRVRAGV